MNTNEQVETEVTPQPTTEETQENGKKSKKNKKDSDKKEKPNVPISTEILSWVGVLTVAVVLACVIRMFVFEFISVDGQSMTNTLQHKETVICSKLEYLLNEPKRNDVIICRYPGRNQTTLNIGGSMSLDTHTLFVKRLVALPGDTVQILDKQLYVNDELVENPEFMASQPPKDYPKVRLGADQYFVIGDNRGNSHDSRYNDVGGLSRDDIVGKVDIVLWPLNKIRLIK